MVVIALALLAILIFISFVLVGGVLLALTIIIAEQLIVRKDLNHKTALREAFHLAKKNFFQMISLASCHSPRIGVCCGLRDNMVLIAGVLGLLVALAFVISKQLGINLAVAIGVPMLALF